LNAHEFLAEKAVGILIDYRKLLVGLVAVLTIILALFIPQLSTDPTMK
jgi:hypothetical protein